MKTEVRLSSVIEICSVVVDLAQADGRTVVLVLELRERRQPQAPLRLVRSHRRELSPQAARHLARLLELAADRADGAAAEGAYG